MKVLDTSRNRRRSTVSARNWYVDEVTEATVLFSNEQVVPIEKQQQTTITNNKSKTAKKMYPLDSKDKKQLKSQQQAPVLFSNEEQGVSTKKKCQQYAHKSTTTKEMYPLCSEDKKQLKNQQQVKQTSFIHTSARKEEKETVLKIELTGHSQASSGSSITIATSALIQSEVNPNKSYHLTANQKKHSLTEIDENNVLHCPDGLNKSITASIATLSKVETISEITKKFCLTSNIDGLHYIVGKYCRFMWRILFIVVTIYCIYQCILNIQLYLSYKISTKITFEPVSVFDFPAITFCPMRTHKKSKYGNIYRFDIGLAFFYANQLSELIDLTSENQRSCNNHNNLSEAQKSEVLGEYNDRLINGSIWLMNKFYMNYQDVLLQCDWDKKRIDCSDAFINHVSDVGSCFTFNPGDELINFTNSTKSGYGINTTLYSEYQFIHSRVTQELKLYININQSEYCGNEKEKRGAGLFFQVHGRNRNPSFLINPSTYISPGFDTKVVMEPTVYRRKTENLGRCSTNVPLYLFNVNEIEYVVEHCLMQCATELIVKSCKCYPPNLGTLQDLLDSKAKDLGIDNSSNIEYCLGSGYTCLKEWLNNVMSVTAVNLLCPLCKQPCQETTYTTEITNLLLSPRNKQIPEFGNVSLTELRKNNIIVSFTLKISDVHFIVEEQQFKKEDLFIYIGNNIGLYLGMSFTTVFELVYFVYQLFVSLWRRYIKIFFKKFFRNRVVKRLIL